MPDMDGLQVLSVVRRRCPRTRTVVLTALMDEQFRARSYAMGADLFWQKPESREGMAVFQDCVQSLLQRTPLSGFCGVQNKSLVDIIQLECLSQNSSVLHITRDARVADIWIDSGNVIDAQAGDLEGEDAFREIMSWKAGHFEILPPEEAHPQRIYGSYQALLLDSAQAVDEAQAQAQAQESDPIAQTPHTLADLAQQIGAEFIVYSTPDRSECWGAHNPEAMNRWVTNARQRFAELGQSLEAGELAMIQASGLKTRVVLVAQNEALLCIGFDASQKPENTIAIAKEMLYQWAS
jgi:CheY-like chemotaxis protein